MVHFLCLLARVRRHVPVPAELAAIAYLPRVVRQRRLRRLIGVLRLAEAAEMSVAAQPARISIYGQFRTPPTTHKLTRTRRGSRMAPGRWDTVRSSLILIRKQPRSERPQRPHHAQQKPEEHYADERAQVTEKHGGDYTKHEINSTKAATDEHQLPVERLQRGPAPQVPPHAHHPR